MWLFVYAIYLAAGMPLMATTACAACIVGIPGAYLAALVRVLVTRPAWLPDPKRWSRAPADSDPAVLQYFYGPAAVDILHAAHIAYGDCWRHWRLAVNAALKSFAGHDSRVTGLLYIAAAVGMTIGTLFGALAAAYCALIHILVVGLSGAFARVSCTALRCLSSIFLRVRKARLVCPACSEPVLCPGYVCPAHGCKRRHRDVRPGRFGILRRRCQCGTSINILPFLGSSGTATFCPHCDQPIERGQGGAPEISLPIFGASKSVASWLLLCMVTQLRAWDRQGQLTAIPADPTTTHQLGANGYRAGNASSPASLHPRSAYAIRLTAGGKTCILRMSEAAHKESRRAERTQEPGYAINARTFILAIDPLTVDIFWARLLPGHQAELKSERSAALSPDRAYELARLRLREIDVQTREARLAVVFTRGALIDARSGKVIRWARRELGLGDLVRSVRRDFKDSCFFCVATPVGNEAMRGSAAPLLRWLLTGYGLSPSPSRIVKDPDEEQQRSYRWHRRYVFASTLFISATLLFLLFGT